MNEEDPLDDFEPREIALDGVTKVVHMAGTGPAVIVMSEMPGIYPLVSRFARTVRDAGFTVWIPHLFGTDGRPLSVGYNIGSIVRGCISREFRAFAADQSSPVIDWLRALASHAHPSCGGRGVGAIGMCFTGNFALSLMLEPAVRAPVLAQPSLPLFRRGGMHIAPDELAQVKARLEREDSACETRCRCHGATARDPRQIRRTGGFDGGCSESTSANPRSRHRANSSVSVTAAGSTLAPMQHVSRCVFSVIIDAQPGRGPKP